MQTNVTSSSTKRSFAKFSQLEPVLYRLAFEKSVQILDQLQKINNKSVRVLPIK